jgi:hypothetical protein
MVSKGWDCTYHRFSCCIQSLGGVVLFVIALVVDAIDAGRDE